MIESISGEELIRIGYNQNLTHYGAGGKELIPGQKTDSISPM
jgi:hypothetical protein